MEEPTTGLVLGFQAAHPFSRVKLTDRASVQELLRTLLDPLEPFFSPAKARVRCPGATSVRFDQAAADVEGICRPLWGLASLIAGGGEYRGTEWWVQGLKSGTDPDHPEFWGYPRDNDQRMVEMCPLGMFYLSLTHTPILSARVTVLKFNSSLGFSLAVAPVFWESMNERERGNVEKWLGNSINEKK